MNYKLLFQYMCRHNADVTLAINNRLDGKGKLSCLMWKRIVFGLEY